jgi:hypothetical protein
LSWCALAHMQQNQRNMQIILLKVGVTKGNAFFNFLRCF